MKHHIMFLEGKTKYNKYFNFPNSLMSLMHYQSKSQGKGFPGSAVVESLPANAGDMDSSPGLGRSHMPQSN